MMGAPDLGGGQMFYRFRDRWQEFLVFLRQLRHRFVGKFYVVCGNFSPHRNAVTAWCAAHDVEPVFTPSMRLG